MPLTTLAPTTLQFDPKLSENARLFLAGVKTYDHFPDEPVASAHNNVVSWLIQGLRMGISPHGNHVHIDATPEEIRQIASDVLVSADLTERVRQYARIQIDAWTKTLEAGSRWDDWGLSAPTFSSILGNLLDHANHVQGSPDRRLLVVFSGHGALSQGAFVLCPRDAVLADAATVRTNVERQDKLLRGHPEHEDALNEVFQLADRRGATTELLDLLEASPIPFQDGLCLSLQGIAKNLRRLQKLREKRPEPSLQNVITPVHLLLALGGMDERVTFVLDACHSGGLQDALQGSQSAHDWSELGLRSRIVSASQKAQRAAEATLGDRRYSAATWALTRVLSRWEPVPDGPAYAMGITNGNLVNRANLLLDALSFNQQISLSAPDQGRRRAADMPFFGLRGATETTVDPSGDAGGIEISTGSNEIFALCFNEIPADGSPGLPKALILVIGDAAAAPQNARKRIHFLQVMNGGAPDLGTIGSQFKLWLLRVINPTSPTGLGNVSWSFDAGGAPTSVQDSSGSGTSFSLRSSLTLPDNRQGSQPPPQASVSVPNYQNVAIKWSSSGVDFWVKGGATFPLSSATIFNLSNANPPPSPPPDGTLQSQGIDFTTSSFTWSWKLSDSW